jgi:hypothetical protein
VETLIIEHESKFRWKVSNHHLRKAINKPLAALEVKE